jgi:ribonuclease R
MIKEEVIKRINHPEYQPETIESLASFLSVDVKELTEHINELINQGQVVLSKKHKIMKPSMANMVLGIIMINQKGNGFVVSDDSDDDLFVPLPYIHSAMHKDTVLVLKHQDKNETIGEVIRIIKRAKTSLVGTVRIKNKKTFLASIDTRLDDWVLMKVKSNQKAPRGFLVVADIVNYDPLTVQYSHSIGHASAPKMDIMAVLLEHDVATEFEKEVVDEANRVLKKKDQHNRIDLTDEMIFTIDGEDAKDLDDAISIKQTEQGYELGVHIADVSFYVEENKAIDREAQKRGTSVYATDVVIPMLPKQLSNDVCSLVYDKPRYTISCFMQINKEGKIVSSKLVPSIIKSKQRFTYTQVNDIIHKQELDDTLSEFVDVISLAYECAKVLQMQREKQGNLDFESQESAFLMENGRVLDIYVRKQQEAENLIENFMVAANESVAYLLKIQHIPAIYRVHEKPDGEKIRDLAKMLGLFGYSLKANPNNIHQNQLQRALKHFKGSSVEPIVNMIALRSMKKATYESTPIGHFGLALEDYLHFTSPIRRYPDLIVHRMIRRYLFEHELDKEQLELDQSRNTEYAHESSLSERRAIDAERAVQDMKKAEFMVQVVGEIFNGVISGVTGFGFFVQLENSVEGLVHIQTLNDDYYSYDAPFFRLVGERSKKVFSLGDTVMIKVKGANKEKRQIDFIYIKHNKA